jgi:Xaa-Pro dipeptidase
VAAAKPGATEADLRGAAGAAMLQGGGDIDFLIIGSTPMANPAMFFGNPRPSERKLAKGDIVIMEIAAGYRGYTAQIGSPICLGPPTDMVRKFWDEITLPGYRKIVAEIKPGNPIDKVRVAAQFFRQNGVQSRPTQIHGIDIVTATPHVFAERTEAREADKVFLPGMVTMAEPNPITADGMFGIFLGHTYIVTESGHEVVDAFPLEIAVAYGPHPSWPGLSRPSTSSSLRGKGVDARDKPGHDDRATVFFATPPAARPTGCRWSDCGRPIRTGRESRRAGRSRSASPA